MFTRLDISHFKAIGPGPLSLDLAPITVLVGENGAGKSSILEALALSAQSARGDLSYRDLVVNGPLLRLYPGDNPQEAPAVSLAFAHDSSKAISVGVEVDLSFEPWAGNLARPPLMPERFAWPPQRCSYTWGRWGAGWRALWNHTFKLDGTLLWDLGAQHLQGNSGVQTQLTCPAGAQGEDVTLGYGAVVNRVLAQELLPQGITSPVGNAQDVERCMTLSRVVEHLRHVMETRFSSVAMLGPHRSSDLMWDEPGEDPLHVGPRGEETLRLLQDIRSQNHPGMPALRLHAAGMGLAGLTSGVTQKKLRVNYRDPRSATILDIQENAYGSRQALMLLCQLFLTPMDACLLIEEPENHLHPAYEQRMADAMAHAVKAASPANQGGRQVILTTHSELFITALADAVRRNAHGLQAQDVALWHLERVHQGVTPERIPMDDQGYLTRWIKSFSAVNAQLSGGWAHDLPEA